jgi:hypothetical protein
MMPSMEWNRLSGEALAGCLLLQAIQIELTVCLQLGREPGQERHPGLIVRCELVGVPCR